MADCTPALCQTEITNDRGGEESAETLPAQPKLSFVVPSGTPSIVIEFCDRCRWLHRATWMQTELFLTFPPPVLGGISLVPCNSPETGGRFRVWLSYSPKSVTKASSASTADDRSNLSTQERTFPESELKTNSGDTESKGDIIAVVTELLWDRKTDGGFPELKVLKQKIRDHLQPGISLGHSDKKST